MKKYITNTFLFCFLFYIINLLPTYFLDPYYGNHIFSEKFKYYHAHQNDYNALILGSSRLYRQINPEILDDSLKDWKISTYNMASPATFNPEVYYLYENLLKAIKKNVLKYVIIELQPVEYIENINLDTVKNFYWHNLYYTYFSINYTLASKMSLIQKFKYIKNFLISYIYKNIYGYKGIIRTKVDDMLYNGEKSNGFYSLDEEMNDIGGNNQYKERLMTFLKDTSVLEKTAFEINNEFIRKNSDNFINNVHLGKIKDLIEKSKEKGVCLIFIIPPRRNGCNELLAIKDSLPKGEIIEIANPGKYPQLYKKEFSFDVGHLNKAGARIFTEYIANELKKNIFKNRVAANP